MLDRLSLVLDTVITTKARLRVMYIRSQTPKAKNEKMEIRGEKKRDSQVFFKRY